MNYSFDKIIDRKKTNSVKFDLLNERFGNEELIPLWVADMDFACPQCITDAIIKRAEHGILGYTFTSKGYYDSIINWLSKRHNWYVKQEEISFVPGVVKGFAFVIDAFTNVGDKVIIQSPVYHPFRIVTENISRKVVYNPLILEEGQYRMDLEGLKQSIDKDCKMLILCNPHNPGGRVWTKQELADLAEICYDNNILVVSDEIHSDLIYSGFRHTPFSQVSEKARNNSITLMAPSKTFNMAGLISSFSVIHNEEIRQKYLNYLVPRELNTGTVFALEATQAAYEHGEDWLRELLIYLEGNIRFVDDFIKKNIPQIKVMIPQATFLVWLDCRELNLSQKNLISLFIDQAHLALNDGRMFGSDGTGFMRINIASPRSVLDLALNNLKRAICEL